MLTGNMEKALNNQLNAEMYSAYLYLSMEAHFASLNLTGMATWMKAQVQEELVHATKFFNFINERGGRVILQAVEQPPAEWDSPLAAFEAALEHERYITGRIDDLVDLAVQQKDHATNSFLQWFVTEQVEEEDSVGKVVEQLKLIQNAPGGLFMLDRELGQRVFAPPADTEQ